MKYIIILALIISANSISLTPDAFAEEFDQFRLKFNIIYNDIGEFNERRNIFGKNLELINKHNSEADAGLHSYRLGVNQFADLTVEEFSRNMNGFRADLSPDITDRIIYNDTSDDLPATIDWRLKNVVTPVKDQANCAACWAFAAVTSIEAQLAMKSKNLIKLSEQHLIDCSINGNMGCMGGYMDNAFQYVIDNNGIHTESEYPYVGYSEKCNQNKSSIGAHITGFMVISVGDEGVLQSAVANIGPVAVGIDGLTEKFKFYNSGVFEDYKCGNRKEDLRHAVNVVGYGTEGGKDYWLVKNSWGTAWGEQGYIRMSRNKFNQCGIATMASFATGVY